jgi:hypothetical protein
MHGNMIILAHIQISFLDQIALSLTGAPCIGRGVTTACGAWVYVGASSNSNFCRIMHIAIFASSNAKFWPMQMRGPQPNGRKAPGSLDDLEIPSANLSGLNSCASLPYQA